VINSDAVGRAVVASNSEGTFKGEVRVVFIEGQALVRVTHALESTGWIPISSVLKLFDTSQCQLA